MSNETIKIDETQKERLDELREDFNYAEPSYSGLVEYLLDSHEGSLDGGAELPDGASNDTESSGVTRTSAGGDSDSDKEDDFQTGGLTAEERAAQFRQ